MIICNTDLLYKDSQAFYLSGTYCHKAGLRPPSCTTPQEPTIYTTVIFFGSLVFYLFGPMVFYFLVLWIWSTDSAQVLIKTEIISFSIHVLVKQNWLSPVSNFIIRSIMKFV